MFQCVVCAIKNLTKVLIIIIKMIIVLMSATSFSEHQITGSVIVLCVCVCVYVCVCVSVLVHTLKGLSKDDSSYTHVYIVHIIILGTHSSYIHTAGEIA